MRSRGRKFVASWVFFLAWNRRLGRKFSEKFPPLTSSSARFHSLVIVILSTRNENYTFHISFQAWLRKLKIFQICNLFVLLCCALLREISSHLFLLINIRHRSVCLMPQGAFHWKIILNGTGRGVKCCEKWCSPSQSKQKKALKWLKEMIGKLESRAGTWEGAFTSKKPNTASLRSRKVNKQCLNNKPS